MQEKIFERLVGGNLRRLERQAVDALIALDEKCTEEQFERAWEHHQLALGAYTTVVEQPQEHLFFVKGICYEGLSEFYGNFAFFKYAKRHYLH